MKNDDEAKVLVPSSEFKSLIDKIAEANLNRLKLEYENENEPYEKYCRRVQLHLIKDVGDYSNRCLQGCRAIFDVI